MLNVTINGVRVEAHEGETILSAARRAGADIPTLCWMKDINEIGSCRVCVVEVEGQDGLAAACNAPVFDGMSVRTKSPKIVEARRFSVKTILSKHRGECTTCKRSGTCALQSLAFRLNVGELEREPDYRREAWDGSFPLQRDASKCISCLRCVAECSKVQHCSVWDFSGSAGQRSVGVKEGLSIDAAKCALCGQCITHCPTGALTERDDVDKVLAALADPNILTVVQVAPAIRTAWGEGVGVPRDEATPGRLAAALRAVGFDRVFDTDFAADLTIMEEGSEFIEWIRRASRARCSPAAARAGSASPSCTTPSSSASSPRASRLTR